MKKILFFFCTLAIGILSQILLTRYLSLYDAAPQVYLLLAVASGFAFGPVTGEILGFLGGLVSDASGVRLFGMNAVLLAAAGFLAGAFRRRVASERLTAQVAMAVVATIYYSSGIHLLHHLFDETPGRFSLFHFIGVCIYNALFLPAFFLFTDWWAQVWKVSPEPM